MTGRHAARKPVRRRVGRTAVSGAAALALTTAWADVAQADSTGNANQYALSVEADALSGNVHNQSFPLTDYIGMSPYSAIARLDSQGASTATAAAPYFGAFLQPLFATFNGVGPGLIPPFPQVPGYVQSTYPATPSAKQSNGTYTINAQSSADRSSGLVDIGITQEAVKGLIHATASTLANTDGSVGSSGEAGAELLNIGGVLTIGKVLSSLDVTQKGSMPPVVSTATRVIGMAVNGMAVGLTEKGVTAIGNTKPFNADDANRAARDALAAAGIEIRYLPSTTVKDPKTNFVQSVDSGALLISVKHDVPGQGEYRLEMSFGRISASTFDFGSAQPAAVATTARIVGDSSGTAATGSLGGFTSAARKPTDAELATVFAAAPQAEGGHGA